LDQWQGRTLLDAMSRPRPDSAHGLASTAARLQHLVKWLPAASNAPLVSGGGPQTVDVLRSIDLLALAVAEGEVWRVTARHGQIRIDKLGTYDELNERLDRFQAAPADRALAGELGALLVPAELFQDRSTLYVVLDATLAALPVAALRRDGKPLSAARPLLRTPRLPTRSGAACLAASAAGGATVLADATGDLPAARSESEAVAALFKTSARVGPAATSTALFAATSDPVLHVAVHGDFDTGGGILRLYDRSVSALEISAARLGPPLVVLSGCNTARSDDPEVAGSLSTAFLASGSSRVVATLRPVSDAGAHQITGRFYREGGLADPVRTLARIQADLAEGDNTDWPHFAVFGSEACEPARYP
jgi:CHAT domain-containing protein